MELWALTSRLLRTFFRSRMAKATALLFALGLLGATWLGTREANAAGVLLLAGLALLAFLVIGAAVGAGSVLPEDRVAGREEWLSTLAPSAWKRRLAAVLGGWLTALALGGGGGLLIGLIVTLARPDIELRAHEVLPVPEENVSRGVDRPVAIPLAGDADSSRLIEVDIRPRFDFYRQGSPVDRIRMQWRAGSEQGEREVSARGAVRLQVPVGADELKLASLTPHVQLRAMAARRLGPPRSPVLGLGWAGFVLGLLAGAVAPVAVLISRRTTAQTAAAAAFSLLLLGAARSTLLELSGQMDAGGLTRIAPALLESLAYVAPQVGFFPLFEDVLDGRIPATLPFAALAYTALVALLAGLPAPRALRSGVNT